MSVLRLAPVCILASLCIYREDPESVPLAKIGDLGLAVVTSQGGDVTQAEMPIKVSPV